MRGTSEPADIFIHLVGREGLTCQLILLSTGNLVAEIRRREIIPYPSGTFLPVVFTFNDRGLAEFVSALRSDLQITVIIGHLARPAMRIGTLSMRVKFISYRSQLLHMFQADRLVATFPDKYRRVVPVIDNHIPKCLSPHIPGMPFKIA